MNDIALQKLVERISLKYFKRPFKHRAAFNSRLRTTGGRYHLQTHNLDFNPKIQAEFGAEIFEGIIKHELCHYHLHLANRGYRHRDVEFKELLDKVGGLRYTPSLEIKAGKAVRWLYECEDCEMKIHRKRRFNTHKFICSQCKGKFSLVGRDEIQVKA